MFKKVLIAEDFDSINIAVKQTLESLGVEEIQYAKYCDDALLKFKKAKQDNEPFDLLISDLSFVADYRKVDIPSGEKLIEVIRNLQPELKVIVYSVEDKAYTIKTLFEGQKINAFVHKGRNSISQLKTAIETLLYGKIFISPDLANILQDKTAKEIDNYDIALLNHLANGVAIDDMVAMFKKSNITPNSKSAIEKRVAKLKDYFKASNNVHLIAIAKDLGVI
ncbi:response regulator [Flavobacterium cucumis]|uniref:DNA-binding response regulator, NarL/FixJ family, contains REC and HTH domains n=1 Tax=Flavobacterium cucumis TaxID=416016 RepID=A0A1M7ZZI2_9FLAO|nr:response regulator [Flavobacterium cucumis]SHO74272.1 DNA-binding response regulator, NarL/FixJ family, contains REC and HTH domains [Flavobacterium cucumis]